MRAAVAASGSFGRGLAAALTMASERTLTTPRSRHSGGSRHDDSPVNVERTFRYAEQSGTNIARVRTRRIADESEERVSVESMGPDSAVG